jgi:hypothetical protein
MAAEEPLAREKQDYKWLLPATWTAKTGIGPTGTGLSNLTPPSEQFGLLQSSWAGGGVGFCIAAAYLHSYSKL